MNVKLLDSSKEKMELRIGESSPAYVNALRRYMAFEVPTMAIEDVEFRSNNSILYDEMVGHRLGLVPLKTDLKSYNLKNECKCKGAGCAQCELKLTLKGSGPKMIYSSDLKSKDPKIKPVYPQIPIVKLLDGQDIAFEAIAVLGTGKEHAKWSPGLIYYRHVPTVKINKQPANSEEVVSRCPRNCFEVKAKKLSVKDNDACILCNDCVEFTNGDIEVGTANDFFMTVESWGQLSPSDIMIKGVEVFNAQLTDFKKLLADVKE
ncbi:MAG: DNA-directed RNA polymerase subunit D [Nanoarchaeota archaeon]|nr:DNA-directed RNA polymerase subunit D [Nanoarchaeota archaeon]